MSDREIKETIEKFLDHLRNNASVDTFVNTDVVFISLGQNELNNRTNRKQSLIAFWLSVLSIIFAGLSFFIAILAYFRN